MMEYDLVTEASKKVGVEPHVLRYWEEELELVIPRNDLGHRYYTEYHIRLLRQIKELKERGYQLKAVKNVLNKMAGVMEDIVITEDDMEEDMKASRKRNQRREGQNRNNRGSNGQNFGKASQTLSAEEEIFQTALEAEMEENLLDFVEAQAGEAKTAKTPEGAGQEAEGADQEADKQTEGAEILSISRERRGAHGFKKDAVSQEDLSVAGEDAEQETGLLKVESGVPVMALDEEKMAQFQEIMNHIIGQAMEANADKLSREITEDVSEQVTDKVMKEVEYLLRVSDEREEERFKQLDETIRAYQKNGRDRAEAAATKLPFFRKKRFGRSGRKMF